MKKLTLLFGLALIIQVNAYSQPCLPEGITFTTQEQIDSFPIDYPDCSEIEGDVWIHGSINDDITNLNGLNLLTAIGGKLSIYSTDSLVNLSGLEGIVSVGGDFEISGNYSLNNLAGLGNLTVVEGNVIIYGNYSLMTLSGLDNLNTIGGSLHIGIHGGGKNYSLSNLNGLESLTSIDGEIGITKNDSLVDITGLNNVDATSITDLTITHNPLLSTCEAESVCEYLGNPNGTVIIYDNDIGCNNPPEIANVCGVDLSCLPYGNYYFVYQSEIDSFQIDYSDCDEIVGDVSIDGYDISNLNGINNISTIDGNLFIGGVDYLIGNPVLTNLLGLEGLTSISGDLKIGHNTALSNLVGLDSLASIGGNLIIGWFNWVSYGNPSLNELIGLNKLDSIGGSLHINYNNVLTSLAGIDNIKAESIHQLSIAENQLLSTCEVISICNYLANPNGGILIQDNATGCNNQQEVEEACETMGIADIIQYPEFSIYPNPATNKLFITSKNGLKIETVNIYNQLGQKILHRNELIENIDISTLGQGIYIIELTSGELKIRQKLIIEQ